MKLGLSRFQARMFSNTRNGNWRTAPGLILSTSISNESLQKAGYLCSQPIITWLVAKLKNRRIPNGTYGGMRGETGINPVSPTRL